jgi:dTDP-glucose 4,6-dehydratase
MLAGRTRSPYRDAVKLFVTGGSGFIGSNFIRYWLGEHAGDEIVNLDLLTYAGDATILADVERSAGDRYSFVRGDISDPALVLQLLSSRRPDVIVNFAAESHNSRALLDPAAFTRTNVAGTQTLLEAARRLGIPRYHQISTCEVFGDLALDSAERFTEESAYRPRTPYNASKASADLIVRAYHTTFAMPITISICCNNYGPWQHPEKAIPLFTTNALDDRPLPIYEHSENRREWLFVLDHCRAIELILLRGRIGETYNIGTGDERSVEQVADTVLAILDKARDLKQYVPDRPGHDRRYLLDHSKIERELGWRPRVTFEQGLAETVNWYAQHRSWWNQKKQDIEFDEFAWKAAPRQA